MSTWACAIGRALVSFGGVLLIVLAFFTVAGSAVWLLFSYPIQVFAVGFLIALAAEVKAKRREISAEQMKHSFKDKP